VKKQQTYFEFWHKQWVLLVKKPKKNIKTLKNLMRPDQNEGFEHEKPFQMPPEYHGYRSRI
jgi:hypothetical protein